MEFSSSKARQMSLLKKNTKDTNNYVNFPLNFHFLKEHIMNFKQKEIKLFLENFSNCISLRIERRQKSTFKKNIPYYDGIILTENFKNTLVLSLYLFMNSILFFVDILSNICFDLSVT